MIQTIVSLTFAVMSGICLITGILDSILANRRRRHIVGEILLSISLLFGGLAITTMTIRIDDVSEPETNDDVYGGGTMSNATGYFLAFGFGCTMGVVATYEYFKMQYEKRLNQLYSKQKPEKKKEVEKKPVEEKLKKEPSIFDKSSREYKNYTEILKQTNYNQASKLETEVEEDGTPKEIEAGIDYISPDEMGKYEVVYMTYYADDILAYDNSGEVLTDEEYSDMVGSEFHKHFGDYSDDEVWVRNYDKQIDYDITRDNHTYEQMIHNQ